jgi:hypothetical protein
MMSKLVKPYWIRTGSTGVHATIGQLVGAFGFTALMDNLRAQADLLDINAGNKLTNHWLIPAEWPEPKGIIWKAIVPFEPEPTPCDPGSAPRKAYRYRIGEHEDIFSVAAAFGQPDGWVKLRQANYDDPGGFVKPAKDCGACTLADFRPGKLVWIPAEWPDPPKSSPLWARIVPVYDSADSHEKGPQAMQTHIVTPGETSGMIAKRYGLSTDQLFGANPNIRTFTDRWGHRDFVHEQFAPGVRLRIPQLVVQQIIRRPAAVAALVGWASSMAPVWNGSYLAYWLQRIDGFLRQVAMTPPTTGSEAATAQRAYALITLPNYWTRLQNWVTSRWATPASMIHEITSTQGWNVGSAALPGFWYAEPWHAFVAAHAGIRGMQQNLWGSPVSSSPGTQYGPGQVGGKAGTTCTPYGAEITEVKPYYYVVQAEDIGSFAKIPGKFNMPLQQGTHWLWQDLRNANLDWPGGFADDGTGGDAFTVCQLSGLYPGAKLKVPGNWLEPKAGVKTVPIGGDTGSGCASGQLQLGNQCYSMPPGVSYPVGGVCPAGTTLFSGLCLPTAGYPAIPGYGCIPGTQQNSSSGLCEVPGGGGQTTSCPTGQVFVPGGIGCVGPGGIPPVAGSCPAPLVLDSATGLCKPPGTSQVKTESKTSEGIPTWLWVLGGGALALGVVAVVASKRAQPPAPKPIPKPASKPHSTRKPASRSASARVPPGSKVSVSVT